MHSLLLATKLVYILPLLVDKASFSQSLGCSSYKVENTYLISYVLPVLTNIKILKYLGEKKTHIIKPLYLSVKFIDLFRIIM